MLVDYWAEWCGPCKMIAPVLDEVARDYQGKLKVCKLNIDENQDTPPKYGVRGIPTLMLFRTAMSRRPRSAHCQNRSWRPSSTPISEPGPGPRWKAPRFAGLFFLRFYRRHAATVLNSGSRRFSIAFCMPSRTHFLLELSSAPVAPLATRLSPSSTLSQFLFLRTYLFPMNLTELKQKPIAELLEMSDAMGLENMARSRKRDIIFALLKKPRKVVKRSPAMACWRFFRTASASCAPPTLPTWPAPTTSVSPSRIRRFNLRTGDTIIEDPAAERGRTLLRPARGRLDHFDRPENVKNRFSSRT